MKNNKLKNFRCSGHCLAKRKNTSLIFCGSFVNSHRYFCARALKVSSVQADAQRFSPATDFWKAKKSNSAVCLDARSQY